MTQAELTRELARQARLTPAAARDKLEEMVHLILKKLQRGQRVDLPGVGKLVSNARPAAGRRSGR